MPRVGLTKALQQLWNNPLQRRVALLTAATVAVAVILVLAAGYATVRGALHHRSEATALTLATSLVTPATEDIRTRGALSDRLRQVDTVLVEAVDVEGRVLGVPGQQGELVLGPGERAAAQPDGKTVQRTGAAEDGRPFVIVAVSMPGTGYALVVGRSLERINEILAAQRLVLLGISLAGVLAAAVCGILIGLSGLRPMRELMDAVEHVTATHDLRPVSVHDARGDLATLASSFNLMLASLTTARDRTSRLVADAGHELRTPLTSLRANVDLLAMDLRRGALPLDQKSDVLSDLQGQLAELNGMIGDLVHVARDEAALVLEPLDVREVVEQAVERVRRRAMGATFEVTLDPLFVVANADSLGRAVSNLLDNAVKWSPPGGVIRVRLEGNRLRVSDAGPGIPDADLPYVFDRFYRGEWARHTKGTGLGLAIVAKTVDEIGGAVEAGRSAEGGAELTLQLPGVTSREAVSALLIPSS